MTVRRLLVTGATGFLGSEFLRRELTWDDGAETVLLVRRRGRASARERVEALSANLVAGAPAAGPPWRDRIEVVEGDLLEEQLGLDHRRYAELAATITEIWHFGADVRFDRPLEVARRIHVDGSLALAALARAAVGHGQFARFHYVSTYAAGRRDDASVVPERGPVLESSFRNSYERSKAEAEAALLARCGEFPLTIHRLGIVVGHSRTGWTPKFDVFYLPIRLLLTDATIDVARLRLPISARALVNAVAIDEVADALFVLGHRERGTSGEVLHLTPGSRATPVTAALAEGMEIYAASSRRLGRAAAPVPEIVAVDDVSPASMAAALGAEVPDEILDAIMHIVPYAFDTAVWENTQLLAALSGSGVEPRPIRSFLGPVIDYVVRSDWGAVPEPRPPLGRPPAV